MSAARGTGALADFVEGYKFALDEYQLTACEHAIAGSGVLVAAPTGAGKTVVGEFAVYLALQQGRKCFYTTPIKALSNQKYADLLARYGSDQVGLLTGDSVHNPQAPVLVMTTEVLRNMIYANSEALTGLGFVVMDEVHYLADRARGAVWEEVIIGLSESVQVIALSATVSNAEEFGEWLAEVRGQMAVVVSERRPVPLYQQVLVGKRLHDLFADVAPTAVTADAPIGNAVGLVNPELVRIAREESRSVRDDSRRLRGRNGRGQKHPRHGSGAFGGGRERNTRNAAPSRRDLVETLRRSKLLPAIVFIFSRDGCSAAVRQLLNSGTELTNPGERSLIWQIIDKHTSNLDESDLDALEFTSFREALGAGIAAHHAGLLPAFKACVEEAFVLGLIKVVFATETLALGINMPARSVVLEKLVKYNGESHVDITPGEYTQLTGRAGRRGIDPEGHAVVLWQPGLDPRAVAGLASRRTYPLRSSFAPTYNMAVNLVQSVGTERARTLLEQSFAQFQSDRSVVGLARRTQRNTEAIAQHWAAAVCDQGDFVEYARMRQEISELEAQLARARRADRRASVTEALSQLSLGDVIMVPGRRAAGWAVVIAAPSSTGTISAQVLGRDRQVRRLTPATLTGPVQVGGRVKIPKHFHARDPASRRSLHAALESHLARTAPEAEILVPAMTAVDSEVTARITALRRELRDHPCHRCQQREDHARHAEQALAAEQANQQANAQIAGRTNSIAVTFDRICSVLTQLGYFTVDQQVSAQGTILAKIFAEADLVAAEALRDGLFDNLTPPQLAAVFSVFIYEGRRNDRFEPPPQVPDRKTAETIHAVRRVFAEVRAVERDARLRRVGEPDIGFAATAYAWCAGEPLADVLHRNSLTAGDFVRWVRQVIDFAEQITRAAPTPELRKQCRAVVGAMRRGVVDFTIDEQPEDPIRN